MLQSRILLFILLFVSVSVATYLHRDHKEDLLKIYEDVEINIDDSTIRFSSKYDPEEYVEITEDHDLFLNGEKISLNRDQRKVVAEYYDLFWSIMEYAKAIGFDGARLGVQSAKIGLKALAGAMKILLTDHEDSELEDELQLEGEKIEEMARDIEDKVEDIEHLSTLLEQTHQKMREEIPPLGELNWF